MSADASKLLGLNVPLTNGPLSGIVAAAASLNVTLTFVTAVPPPASDIRSTLCPAGPTSKISKSSGKVWVRLFRVTVTFVTVPPKPEALMVDG